ncbi:MAG: ribonuclease R [endosymbiont of Galathealinum brachiosum]|uniref:Ribonuclease R n=1 Tax=endosymbiont of Galathealinum brachiosum TaxID=2200906 RepID=A0A370D7Z9_9GAMM|nr:MAG: ribonuclease R [endosymbiont of Galathealinum brachiosum]
MANFNKKDSKKDGKRDHKKNKKRHKKSHSKKHSKSGSNKPDHNKSNKPLVDPQSEREASNYENPIASRELILQVVQEEGAMSHDHLLNALKMHSPEQKEALRRRLNAMVRDGQLIRNRRDGYIPVNEEDLISGRVIAHPDGFGFLVPDEGGDDLFLHGRQMRSLLHGDRAVVQVSGIDRRGRREGAVIDVIERANDRIVGRLFIESGICFVVADNKRITQDIMVPQDQLNEANHGQIVIVEITQQPTFRHKATGKITDIIGDHMAPGMEIDIAIHAHNLPFLWPDEVKEQIKGIKDFVTEEDKKGRRDITGLPLVTIDGEDARDFDDAVYCEETAKGWKLLVAIADVSHYVQRGTPLDEEGYNRATSVYFPERVIPMLPEVLSNGLCSLNPKVDRLCMVCEMHFNKAGKLISSDFSEAVMYSHARLTYNKVSAMLEDNDQALREEYKDVLPHLETLYSLYKVLIKQRKKRGSIDFETTETRIVFDENQRIEKIVPTSRNEAHKIIEECMISANIAAAQFIQKHEIPGLFRSHNGPKTDKIDDVIDFVKGLGLKIKLKGEMKALDYASIINQAKERDDFHLIQTVLLRSMQQAVYSPENEGHFGLSLDHYAHFTSPIRRYPDLLVHRAIRHVIQGQKVAGYFYRESDMVHLGEHCSANERRADEATRDAVSSLKCEFMQARIGNDFKGTITSVTSFGIFIELNEIFVEGLVHITNLPKDYYQFEPVTHRLIGERAGEVFQLGDSVTINVAGVNMDERKIDFELLSHEEQKKSATVVSIETAKKKKKDKKKSSKKPKEGKKLAASKKAATKKPAAKKKVAKKEEPKKKTVKKKAASKKTESKKPVAKKAATKKAAAKKTATKKKAVSKAAPKKAVTKKKTVKKTAPKKAVAKKKAVKKVAPKKKVVKKVAPKKKAVKKAVPKKKAVKKVAPKKKTVKKVAPKKKAVKKVVPKKKAVKKVVPKKKAVKKVAPKKKAVKKVTPKKKAVKKVAPKKKAVKKVAPKKKAVKKVAPKKKVVKKVTPKKKAVKKVAPKKKVVKKVAPKKKAVKKVAPKKKAVKKVAPKKKVVKKVTPKKKAVKKKAKKK